MLLMSNALLPFFFFKREDRFAGMDCPKDGVGLGVDVGVNGEDTTVGKDKLLARFCSWAAALIAAARFFLGPSDGVILLSVVLVEFFEEADTE